MGTNRDPGWWWRLSPGGRLAVAGCATLAVLAVAVPVLWGTDITRAVDRARAEVLERERAERLRATDRRIRNAEADLLAAGALHGSDEERAIVILRYLELQERGFSREVAIGLLAER